MESFNQMSTVGRFSERKWTFHAVSFFIFAIWPATVTEFPQTPALAKSRVNCYRVLDNERFRQKTNYLRPYGTGTNRLVDQGSHRLGVHFQSGVAGFAPPNPFHRRQIAIGRARDRRVHRHGAGRANLFSISQGQDGHGIISSRERFDVQ